MKAILAAALAGAAVSAAAGLQAAPRPRASSLPLVRPLAASAVEPGVGRCTSDGVCTVVDEAGVRPGPRVSLGRREPGP